jgi:hypothetical protein
VKHGSSSRCLSVLIAFVSDPAKQFCAPIKAHDQQGRNYRRRQHQQNEHSGRFGRHIAHSSAAAICDGSAESAIDVDCRRAEATRAALEWDAFSALCQTAFAETLR